MINKTAIKIIKTQKNITKKIKIKSLRRNNSITLYCFLVIISIPKSQEEQR